MRKRIKNYLPAIAVLPCLLACNENPETTWLNAIGAAYIIVLTAWYLMRRRRHNISEI